MNGDQETFFREHKDACGIFGVLQSGEPSHELLDEVLEQGCQNLDHREGRLPNGLGDGIGIAFDQPRQALLERLGMLEEHPQISLGVFFVSQDFSEREGFFRELRGKAQKHHLKIFQIEKAHDFDASHLEALTERQAPLVYYCYFEPLNPNVHQQDFEQSCYNFLQQIETDLEEKNLDPDLLRVISFSPHTLILKGLGSAEDLKKTWGLLSDTRVKVSRCVSHQRFSTNTFPSWWLAQPFFSSAHNGEINTISKNRRTAMSLEKNLRRSRHYIRIKTRGGSDSADMDRVLLQRYIAFCQYYPQDIALAAALETIIPPAQNGRYEGLSSEYRQWLEFHRRHLGGGSFFGGPAAVISFTRGALIGKVDNMALRPLKWALHDLNGRERLFLSSEYGAIPGMLGESLVDAGLLGPGELVVGTRDEVGRLLLRSSDEIRDQIVMSTKGMKPSKIWSFMTHQTQDFVYRLEDMVSDRDQPERLSETQQTRLAILSGWKKEQQEDLHYIACFSKLRVQAMGTELPMAALREPLAGLFDFAQQDFAQVTNPPIDSIREGDKFDLTTCLGGRRYNTAKYSYSPVEQVFLKTPLVTNADLQKILFQKHVPAARVSATVPVGSVSDGNAYDEALRRIGQEAVEIVRHGKRIAIISQRCPSEDEIPLESPLVLGAVLKALNESSERQNCSVIIESSDVKEAHDIGLLLAMGANAINPFLAEDTVSRGSSYTLEMTQDRDVVGGQNMFVGVRKKKTVQVEGAEAVKNLHRGLTDGLKKIMSKMGINDIDGYRSSALFTIEGLGKEVRKWLNGLNFSPIGGQDMHFRGRYLQELFEASRAEILPAYKDLPDSGLSRSPDGHGNLGVSSLLIQPLHELMREKALQDIHPFNGFRPEDLSLEAARLMVRAFDRLRSCVGFGQHSAFFQLRDLLKIEGVSQEALLETPVIQEDIERAVREILPRMRGGQMSFGALQPWAKIAIEKALNALGTFGGSGEGGVPKRYIKKESIPKSVQIASGRFGVTAEYLAFSQEICIKMAQGAKPGEGGQLPGHKVNPEIAENRFCTPGTELISPPPHHDIYSIEELLQLMEDLLCVNPSAQNAVKLVSGTNIGIIGSGVRKAAERKNLVEVDGVEGGTGAAPNESRHHAGLRSETGIADLHQCLQDLGLRDTTMIRGMGGIKCSLDMLKYFLLGCDEIAAGTLLMNALDCNNQRNCDKGCGFDIAHPLSVRGKDGKPKGAYKEFLESHADRESPSYEAYIDHFAKQVYVFWFAMALELAQCFRLLQTQHRSLSSFADVVGQTDLLQEKKPQCGPASTLDLRALLLKKRDQKKSFSMRTVKDFQERAEGTLLQKYEETGSLPKENIFLRSTIDRSFGARLSGYRVRSGRTEVLELQTSGHAGNSYAVWGSGGMRFLHTGFCEEGVAKGICDDCRVSVLRPKEIPKHVPLVSNNVGFGATGGSIFIDSLVGQRCGIRLSGHTPESTRLFSRGGGQYGAEYMTGGTIILLPDPVLLGAYEPVKGRFGSGMSGGEAFVWVDKDQDIFFHLSDEEGKSSLDARELSEDPDLQRIFFSHLTHFLDLGLCEQEYEFWRKNLRNSQGKVMCVRICTP